MEKFSVIVPTIWKGTEIFDLLKNLYACENVCEVILINNNRKETPDFVRHEKLVYVEPDTNIYCNPAWNMGVRMAKSDSIIIAQDDTLFDVDLFVNSIITIDQRQIKFEEMGFIGMDYDNFGLDYDGPRGSIEIKPTQRKAAWACIMAFHRKWWIPVPDELKIWYGDDFIKTICPRLFDFCGLPIKGKISTSADTSVDWVKKIVDEDFFAWQRISHEIYSSMARNQQYR